MKYLLPKFPITWKKLLARANEVYKALSFFNFRTKNVIVLNKMSQIHNKQTHDYNNGNKNFKIAGKTKQYSLRLLRVTATVFTASRSPTAAACAQL